MKNRSHDKLILGPLNTNSLRNKFDSLKNTISRGMDILLTSETKLDDSLSQFKIDGFSAPFRFDRNSKRGVFLMYIREDIPSRQLFRKSQCYIGTNQLKSILKKRKWF